MIIAEIMLPTAGILPMGMPLHDPVVICLPLVISLPSQKLMKLLSSLECVSKKKRHVPSCRFVGTYVADAAWPGLIPKVPDSWPVKALALWIKSPFKQLCWSCRLKR